MERFRFESHKNLVFFAISNEQLSPHGRYKDGQIDLTKNCKKKVGF
ncbi:MAG: hypothetical protein MI922_28515 [Bacteroidales bacterium]|nr:hypothetical protein [Bacteroidales bacterium]